MEKVKAVVFDLDGTLADSVKLVTDSWVEALRCFGIRKSRSFVQELEGVAADEKAKIILPRRMRDRAKELMAVRRCMEIRELKKLRLFPGVPRLLERLKGKGLKIAVASSSSRPRIERFLKTFRIRKYVDVIVGREDYQNGRPAPDILIAATKKLRVKPGECLAVGDTKWDVEAANRAGCLSVALLSGTHSRKEILKRKPHFVIRKIPELQLLW